MPSTPSSNAIQCPLCLGLTGRARTAPELRFAELRSMPSFTDTTVEVRPCEPCREYNGKGLVSVTLLKSRAMELAWDTSTSVRHRDGLVSFG